MTHRIQLEDGKMKSLLRSQTFLIPSDKPSLPTLQPLDNTDEEEPRNLRRPAQAPGGQDGSDCPDLTAYQPLSFYSDHMTAIQKFEQWAKLASSVSELSSASRSFNEVIRTRYVDTDRFIVRINEFMVSYMAVLIEAASGLDQTSRSPSIMISSPPLGPSSSPPPTFFIVSGVDDAMIARLKRRDSPIQTALRQATPSSNQILEWYSGQPQIR
ncbi:hypothetical protein C8J56DRAFT_880491 [Mycena floridula]|nr:hypothetical protein C8J56DRAFT_880491 [Mycena floridula]